jgi:hypothetical protein
MVNGYASNAALTETENGGGALGECAKSMMD